MFLFSFCCLIFVSYPQGNGIINNVFEHSIPASVKKPSSRHERATKDAWINAKYVEKQFIGPSLSKETLNEQLWNVKDAAALLSLIAHGKHTNKTNKQAKQTKNETSKTNQATTQTNTNKIIQQTNKQTNKHTHTHTHVY